MSRVEAPWYADYANFLVGGIILIDLSYPQRNKFQRDVRMYVWDDPYLFKRCNDGVLRRCIASWEVANILEQCHNTPYSGHYGASRTASRVFECRFY